MKCLLCGNEIPTENGKDISFSSYLGDREIIVCGRCHLLTCINDNLKPQLKITRPDSSPKMSPVHTVQ